MSAPAAANEALPRYRPLAFGVTRGVLREGAPGVRYLEAETPLEPYGAHITSRLLHWAEVAPDRSFIARRERLADGSTGDWIHISYAQALEKARRIGQGLLDRGLSAQRPVAILSENSLEHALMVLGCLYAGVPHCSVSPPYSIVSRDYDKLRHVLATLTPGLVFAGDEARYGRAIREAVPADIEVVLVDGEVEGRRCACFSELLATEPTPAVDAAMRATGPDTITK
ncbi:MAG TPA: AMP-binding protein, partial [Ramlibacter sp.]